MLDRLFELTIILGVIGPTWTVPRSWTSSTCEFRAWTIPRRGGHRIDSSFWRDPISGSSSSVTPTEQVPAVAQGYVGTAAAVNEDVLVKT